MNDRRISVPLRQYLDLCRHVGKCEGALMACRIALQDSDKVNLDAIDELLEWSPTVSVGLDLEDSDAGKD